MRMIGHFGIKILNCLQNMRKILSLTTEQANQPKPGMMSKEDDVVIIYSKEHPKLPWKRGIILELLKSDDGQIRKAKVRTKTTETVKALNHLYPLEAKVEEAIEEYYRDNKINTFEFEGFTQDEQIKNRNRVETLRKSMTTSVSNGGKP